MGFGSKSASILSIILKKHKELTHLDFSINNLGSNLKPIIDALKMSSRVIDINLSNNSI